MDQGKNLHSTRRVVYNKDYSAFQYDRIFASKLLNRSWEYDCEEHKPCDENYQRLFVWPPRFYSCNFCDREFSSAQALGGHMNVHRRDRARLRQGLHPDPNDEDRTTLHAPTLERSNSRTICGYKRAPISPRVCTFSPNSSVIREKAVKFLMKDDPPVSSKRRCTNTLMESQDAEVLDLELRL